jgi:hypothetical protein
VQFSLPSCCSRRPGADRQLYDIASGPGASHVAGRVVHDILPFQPAASGFASVFAGFYPVALVTWLSAMIWLELLFMRARSIPAMSFVEQPPTYGEAFNVQRFQAPLSSFTAVWNYLAAVTFIFWVLFYVR